MSYILEALKKSERERNLGAIPDLDTIQEQVATRSNWWPWLVVALVLLNGAIGIAFFTWRPADQAASQSQGGGDMQRLRAVTNPAPAVSDRREASSAQAELSESPAREAVSGSVPIHNQSPPEESGAALAKADPIETQPEPVPTEPSAAAPLIDEPVDLPVAKPSVTKWEDMPADFRARVARPEIDVHAYSSQPQRRFVLIELKKYRQGERLNSGVEIETITEDGVIFSDQGTRFWVARP